MHPIVRFILLLLMCAAALGITARVMLAADEWFAPVVVWGSALALASVDACFRHNEH